jgi:hypothetical protein
MGDILHGGGRSKQAGPFEYNKGASLRANDPAPRKNASPLDPVFLGFSVYLRLASKSGGPDRDRTGACAHRVLAGADQVNL